MNLSTPSPVLQDIQFTDTYRASPFSEGWHWIRPEKSVKSVLLSTTNVSLGANAAMSFQAWAESLRWRRCLAMLESDTDGSAGISSADRVLAGTVLMSDIRIFKSEVCAL